MNSKENKPYTADLNPSWAKGILESLHSDNIKMAEKYLFHAQAAVVASINKHDREAISTIADCLAHLSEELSEEFNEKEGNSEFLRYAGLLEGLLVAVEGVEANLPDLALVRRINSAKHYLSILRTLERRRLVPTNHSRLAEITEVEKSRLSQIIDELVNEYQLVTEHWVGRHKFYSLTARGESIVREYPKSSEQEVVEELLPSLLDGMRDMLPLSARKKKVKEISHRIDAGENFQERLLRIYQETTKVENALPDVLISRFNRAASQKATRWDILDQDSTKCLDYGLIAAAFAFLRHPPVSFDEIDGYRIGPVDGIEEDEPHFGRTYENIGGSTIEDIQKDILDMKPSVSDVLRDNINSRLSFSEMLQRKRHTELILGGQ